MLLFDEYLPPGAADGLPLLVLLHGRGSHKDDLQALRPALPPGWGLVTPQGPHPGHPWGYGPGWAWYRYVEEDRVDEATLQQGLDALGQFMDEIPGALGVRPGRVAIGGFSQGGTTALAWALRAPARVDSVLVFSGFLIDSKLVPAEAAAGGRPRIFWGHGRRDPAIPFVLAEKGRKRLREVGAALVARDFEIGHWIAPEEIGDAMAFLEKENA
jgi:phospholipase/carboxylesterase